MSIYSTLWTLKFPKEGDEHRGCEWIEVTAQAVPAHIGSPTPGCGYEDRDPYAAFLPPALQTDAEGDAPFHRAVVFVTEYSTKGTPRSPQEYASPLLVLTGEEYSRITFGRVGGADGLRGLRANDRLTPPLVKPDRRISRIRLSQGLLVRGFHR
jgi:hypothetical protein